MCYQCFLAGGNSVALGASHGLGEPSLRSIPVEQLIASDFESFTKQQVLTDGVLDLYLHQPAGPVTVNGGGYGVQTIQTVAVDEAFAVFFRNAVEQLDAEIDLDFRFVDSPEAADIRFYLDSEIALGDGGLTLGIALTNDTPQQKFWEIMLNTPAFEGDIDYLYYAALHELLHALGGEHPFDDSDGDVFVSSNSSSSAYPDETLLAYRSPQGESWPTWFTFNDLAALRAIWGSESGNGVSTRAADPMGDRLIGTAFNDVLTGGGGADELWGGKGSNQFFSASDAQQDWLLISRDGSSRLRRTAGTVDDIAELGAEDRIGVLAARTNRLRFESTKLQSQAYGLLEGTGIYVGKRLEAIYTGDDLTRAELQDLTVGLPASYTGDLG